MSNNLIYSASIKQRDHVINYVIAFIPHQQLDLQKFLLQLKTYFQENIIPEHIVIIAGTYLKDDFKQFLGDSTGLKEIVPVKYYQDNPFEKFMGVYLFNGTGALEHFKGIVVNDVTFDKLFRIGLTQIFNRGGLISAQESHHFVFPSGKHCDKFLRTGNVLIRSQDIYFIAFNLLKRCKIEYRIIYCDTSSINSLAFALVELKRRFNKYFVCPHIESYGSYKGFEEGEFIDRHEALFLVSSSTSANIIDRLIERHIDADRIALIYCLDANKHQHLVVCDLKKDEDNTTGVELFRTFGFKEKCEFCDSGSIPVPIQGDVFLLEKPLINKVVFRKSDAPGNLSKFLEKYRHKREIGKHFIKCNYFESSVRSSSSIQFGYEVFFDVQSVFEDLEQDGDAFRDFKESLNRFIHQYIPSNVRYIIHLNDKGSELFANYLRKKIEDVVKDDYVPELVPMHNITSMNKERDGAALIVCSSMVSGGNLIYVSKELRKFEKLSLIYLVGFTRTGNEDYYKFIRGNLGQGTRGVDTNSFYSVETIHCNNDYKNTSWIIENDFIRLFLLYLENTYDNQEASVLNFFKSRLEVLKRSMQVDSRGFANEIFYSNPYTNEPLKINKNFAFFDFHGYDEDVSQSDIYFTISTVINKLRHSKDLKHCLKQSEYVRNLIDPENFTRFNDGIIQASILRAAYPLELAYDIDKDISRKFLSIITPIIINAKDHYGEALLEFLYAICIKKLRLEADCLKEMVQLIDEKCSEQLVLMALTGYIKKAFVEKDEKVFKDYTVKYSLF